MLRESVEAMTYRKLLVIAEPCYSEAVLTPLKDQLHVLGISGASADEQSWADCWDYDYSFWMCDRFSRNVILYLFMKQKPMLLITAQIRTRPQQPETNSAASSRRCSQAWICLNSLSSNVLSTLQ